MKIGITSWIWTSPLTTDRFPEIAQHVARLGFDLLEVPIEGTGDLDYKKAAGVVKDLGLGTSVCAAMSPALHRLGADARRHQRGGAALQRGRAHLAGDGGRA